MSRNKRFDENDILDKAMQLFWSKGYHATSVQDLTETLGISRSSLYDTFGDKHALYIAALQQYRTKMGGAMLKMVRQTDDIKKTLRTLFEMTVTESVSDKMMKGCFMVNSSVELSPWYEDVAIIANQNMKDVESAYYEAIIKGQKNGQVSKKHKAEALASFLFNSMNGLRVSAKNGPNEATFNNVVEVSLSVLDD